MIEEKKVYGQYGYTSKRNNSNYKQAESIFDPFDIPVKKVREKVKEKDQTTHTHPSMNSNTKIEKRTEYVGSLGKNSSEGCDDLAGVRLLEKENTQYNIGKNASEIRRAIIMSEILGKPKCKK